MWLNELGITVACVVEPDKPAVLDVPHRVFLNYETYYLSSANALQRFNEAPWRFCGPVTDPVSKERFQPGQDSLSVVHDGRRFYFAAQAEADAFAADPAAYATPVVPYAGNM